MNKVIGIDVGMSGGICFYSENDFLVYDMPTFEITKNGGKRKKIDVKRLIDILKYDIGDAQHVFIEQVSAQPGNGAAAAFTYGFGCGVVEAVVQALNMPFTYVTPMRWKKDMSCPADKDSARLRASQLLPQHAHNWDRKKDDGRAEAALIALWGSNNLSKHSS